MQNCWEHTFFQGFGVIILQISAHLAEASEADGRRVVEGTDGERPLLEDELPGGDVARGHQRPAHARHGHHGERVALRRSG